MVILRLIDDAIEQRKENDKNITGEFLANFRAMFLKDKKTAVLALDLTRQRELLAFLSVAELQTIKTELEKR